MKYTPLSFVFLIASFSTSAAQQFGDPIIGERKAPSCIYCHTKDGSPENSGYPHLNGQNAEYLYQSMKSYQTGQRKGPLAEMMKAQLQKLNDLDLKDVAAFYAELP
ncbi:c-type cytochrome [Vibrio sp. TRT 17S01]|uniref:c-type cytochrome n=1 Tax=Vibrio sp. TRT 17S01 TaxID=3418505 RepID=UPI003CF6822B